MASVVTACYRCGAPVPAGAYECPGCGAAQTEVAQAVWMASEPLRATIKASRIRTVTALIVGVVIGATAGLWLGGAASVHPTSSAAASQHNFTREQALSLFVPNVENFFLSQKTPIRMGIKGWVFSKDSAVVLELDPTTSDWRMMDDQARIAIMGILGAGYDQALRVGGIVVNPRTDGFPVVDVVYAGQGKLLASRVKTGQIYLYDHSNQSEPSPASGTPAPPPDSLAHP